MFKLIYDELGFANAIEKDGQIILNTTAALTTDEAENIVEQLNGYSKQKEKAQLFNWILEEISRLGCTSYLSQLHNWFMLEDENQREFRLGGIFGSGFKIRRQFGVYYFDQYPEDETAESKKWIIEMNECLREYYANQNKEGK